MGDGIVVQTSYKKTLNSIVSAEKDVGCTNATEVSNGSSLFSPPGASAVLQLLLAYAVPLAGQSAVVLCSETEVGVSIAHSLEKEGCHTSVIPSAGVGDR